MKGLLLAAVVVAGCGPTLAQQREQEAQRAWLKQDFERQEAEWRERERKGLNRPTRASCTQKASSDLDRCLTAARAQAERGSYRNQTLATEIGHMSDSDDCRAKYAADKDVCAQIAP